MLRLTIVSVLLALVAGAYWGTKAHAATKPRSSVHCLVFRFAIVGNQAVLLDQKPVGEVPCPRSKRA